MCAAIIFRIRSISTMVSSPPKTMGGLGAAVGAALGAGVGGAAGVGGTTGGAVGGAATDGAAFLPPSRY